MDKDSFVENWLGPVAWFVIGLLLVGNGCYSLYTGQPFDKKVGGWYDYVALALGVVMCIIGVLYKVSPAVKNYMEEQESQVDTPTGSFHRILRCMQNFIGR